MRKNVAGQIVAAQMTTAADGSDFTGTVAVYLVGDNGAQTLLGNAVHKGNGLHTYALSQASTNYDHAVYTFKATGAITVSAAFYTWAAEDLKKIRAAVYDSAPVAGGIITLSDGATQSLSANGRVTAS
jgi:hypothetical protein